jgi:hypothetical protein
MRTVLHLLGRLALGYALLVPVPGHMMTAHAANAPVPASLSRIQMHRNAVRALVYVPNQPSGDSEPNEIRMRILNRFTLPGDGRTNVRANVYPIDATGNGTYGFVFYNGYRTLRVFDRDGDVRWSVENSSGRIHRSPYHRDTLAVVDADGNGTQDIIHCWLEPGQSGRFIQVRDGATGHLIRSVKLAASKSGDECQIGAFYMSGRSTPIILVSRTAMAGAECRQNFVDVWSRTTAYDLNLRQLWDKSTCDAGHYVWPLDEDRNGYAEGVFIGKYLYRADGTRACTLAGWGRNHIDSMVMGNFAGTWSGHEMLSVGENGTRFYSARNCALRWSIGTGMIPNPQQVQAAWLDGPGARSDLFIQEKATGKATRKVYNLDTNGRILGSYTETTQPTKGVYQTGNVDGARAREDRIGAYGQVIGEEGHIRLSRDWYWDQQELSESEQQLLAEEKWSFTPLVFDINGDGRDEIITWGRHAFVIGESE